MMAERYTIYVYLYQSIYSSNYLTDDVFNSFNILDEFNHNIKFILSISFNKKLQ